MNRFLKPKLFISNQRKLLLAFSSRFSVDTGSKEHIEGLVKDKKVVVFMKGTADKPRCGFSNAVVQILNFHGVDDFDHHNVLDDESLRQGILPVCFFMLHNNHTLLFFCVSQCLH